MRRNSDQNSDHRPKAEDATVSWDKLDDHGIDLSLTEENGPLARLARAHTCLLSMVDILSEEQSLIVAVDPSGFPIVQMKLVRPQDLPRALVVGRHPRCTLSVPDDASLSLRHFLLTLWPGQGPSRIGGVDLGGRSGIVIPDGRRVSGFFAHDHLAITLGKTCLYVIPGGRCGRQLLEQCELQKSGSRSPFRTSINVHPTSDVTAPGARLTPELGVTHVGGYRAVERYINPVPRGTLRLCSTQYSNGREQIRDLAINDEQIRRGLLIGRYSDRCTLAGEGRNLSRVHALICEENSDSLLVYDLASTNGVRPMGQFDGPSHAVVRITPTQTCMLGHFELSWRPT